MEHVAEAVASIALKSSDGFLNIYAVFRRFMQRSIPAAASR